MRAPWLSRWLLLASAAARAAALPIQTRGLQGVDDDDMTQTLLAAGDTGGLALRYAHLSADIAPGVRRYNVFWSSIEGAAPSSTTLPPACPPGTQVTPASEAERVRRGFNRFHCYSTAPLERLDDILARDAAIGAASAFIVYGSPAFAQDPACTGFPWPPSANYKSGCLPWGEALLDWEDYINLLVERWHAPWGSGRAAVSGLCIWNEVQSMGWSDPSPVLPNRATGQTPFFTPAQMAVYAGMIANLTLLAGRAASRQNPENVMLWLSTDHFTVAPKLAPGDVGHVGLYELLDAVWPLLNATVPWGVAVHPYDAGDPRANLSARGIYTFATLRADVAEYQCRKLAEVAGVPLADCYAWPQTQMWASEQGWPQGPTMNKTLQGRNICLAHELSLSQRLWAVTHNLFPGAVPSNQGGGGDYSLIDEPPLIAANLSFAAQSGRDTYLAYMATAPGVFGLTSAHYCCTRWAVGCVPQ